MTQKGYLPIVKATMNITQQGIELYVATQPTV